MEIDPILKTWADNATLNRPKLCKPNIRSLSWIINNNYPKIQRIALVGAGPSLDESCIYLKEHQDDLFIVSSDAALPHLIDNAVKPDIVVTIDPHSSVSTFYKDYVYDGMVVCCPVSVAPQVLDHAKAKYFIFLQSEDWSSKKKVALAQVAESIGTSYPSLPNRFFVGATMLQISNLLSPSSVTLFGYDFSYKNGRLYCEGTLRSKCPEDPIKFNDERFEHMLDTRHITDMTGNITTTRTGLCTASPMPLYLSTFKQMIAGRQNIINSSVDVGSLFLPYVHYSKLETTNEKISKPDIWHLYPRKRHR